MLIWRHFLLRFYKFDWIFSTFLLLHSLFTRYFVTFVTPLSEKPYFQFARNFGGLGVALRTADDGLQSIIAITKSHNLIGIDRVVTATNEDPQCQHLEALQQLE